MPRLVCLHHFGCFMEMWNRLRSGFIFAIVDFMLGLAFSFHCFLLTPTLAVTCAAILDTGCLVAVPFH